MWAIPIAGPIRDQYSVLQFFTGRLVTATLQVLVRILLHFLTELALHGAPLSAGGRGLVISGGAVRSATDAVASYLAKTRVPYNTTSDRYQAAAEQQTTLSRDTRPRAGILRPWRGQDETYRAREGRVDLGATVRGVLPNKFQNRGQHSRSARRVELKGGRATSASPTHLVGTGRLNQAGDEIR